MSDEIYNRLTALDPASDTPELTEGAKERIARMAMSDAPRPWTWARFRLATAGALVATSAIVVAGIAAIQAAAPSLEVLAIGASGRDVPAVGDMALAVNYQFSADPSLPSSSSPATVYKLAPMTDTKSAASELATAFGVSGDPVSNGTDSYQVGPDAGPYVSAYTSDGSLNWNYQSAAVTAPSTSTNTSTDPTTPPGNLPSESQAATDASTLLASLSITGLGTPQVSTSSSEVDVTVPWSVDGTATDQTFYLAYGAGDTLLSASGILDTAQAQSAYPTIAPTDAVNYLQAHNGFTMFGGVLPPVEQAPGATANGVTTAPTPTTGSPTTTASPSGTTTTGSTTTGSTTTGGPTTGSTTTGSTTSGSGSDGSGSTTTGSSGDGSGGTTTTTTPLPVIYVNINSATLELGTYTMSNGESWLLPVWALSGPETGTTVTGTQTYSSTVLAVERQYVDIAPMPIAF